MTSGGEKTVLVCQGTACVSSESPKIREAIEQEIKRLSLDGACVKFTGCHGFCQRGPIVIVEPEGIFYSEVKPEDAAEIVCSHLKKGKPVERLFYRDPKTGEPIPHYRDIDFYKKQQRNIVLRNCGHINPENIDDYLAVGGYQALSKALLQMKPEQVVEEIKRSGLRGRGGAGFPTGRKWEFCRNAEGQEKYVICNADEGDPGAFMDRSILEADPHSVIEGLIIAGYAIGASRGFIYCRAEYPLALERLRIAIAAARQCGLLGKNIHGSGFDFDVEIKEGAGAFVCGEETALIASIEGMAGRPRPRPPYPARSGLWGKPTTINNVKSLASVPVIISRGADWYARIGTAACKGTAVFALTGHIANCGLVEVAMGTTLREIIYDIGGGVPGGKALKAVQTGGPSGGCLPASFLDTPVDYESLAAAGSIMGSGGMVVMDEDTCMVDIARYFLDFTQRESCGKCVPCRLGTKQLLDILTDITQGRGKPGDIDLLVELGEAVKAGALCGLGQTAPNPVLTTIRYFRDEYEAHILQKRCPAAVCKELISSPCQHTCPLGTEAPLYISLVARGRFAEALEVIRKDNPLPAVCSRVCHHPCELKCQCGKWAEPIAVRTIKRFVTDHAIASGAYDAAGAATSDKEKVAIIGSGPAGLTAAYFLARKGYDVTVFEAMPVAGGGLVGYIPAFRLPRDIIKQDIDNIVRAGVKIRTNTRVGKDIAFDELRNNYAAVFIATGAHKARALRIDNLDADGVMDAMEYLGKFNLGKDVPLGRRVGIIGGGNVAVDSARVAIRDKKCEKVLLIYRRTRAEMPAFEEEVEAALAEGVEIQFLTAPLQVITREGKVVALRCQKMELGKEDESGRRRPVPIPNSEFVIDLDTLLVAIGEEPDLSFLPSAHGLNVSDWNTLIVDAETMATNVPGVFAGGDVVSGPATVIEAMGAGKVAAEMIEKYIRGEDIVREYDLTRPSEYVQPVELTDEEVEEAKRVKVRHLALAKRAGNFHEIEFSITAEEAIKEARRCLRCDLETEDGKEWMKQQKAEEVMADE